MAGKSGTGRAGVVSIDNFGFGKPADVPALLEPEFHEHYNLWKKDPTTTNTQTLLKALDPVIASGLRTFSTQGKPSPTLRSRAKLLVLDALPRYDPNKAKLRTHLMVNLQGLQRATAEENQIIGVPERVRLDQHRLYAATQELRDSLGRDPSDGELSSHMGLSLRRLEHIRKNRGSLSEGQTTSVNEEGEEYSFGPSVVRKSNDGTWLRFIYADLDPRDQLIMEHTLGLHGKSVLPKGEIARKLGLSAGAISQRAARIQKLIDSKDDIASNLF